MLGDEKDVLLSRRLGEVLAGREQLAAAVQPLGQRGLSSAVENPLVSKLSLFPVKISTAL